MYDLHAESLVEMFFFASRLLRTNQNSIPGLTMALFLPALDPEVMSISGVDISLKTMQIFILSHLCQNTVVISYS